MKMFHISVFFICLLSTLSATPIDTYLSSLSEEEKAKLIEHNELVEYSEGAPAFRLLPNISLSAAVKAEFEDYEPNVSDEALFLLPKVENQNILPYIYEKLRNISSLSGIQYHSNHYHEWKTLFDNVFETDNVGSDAVIPFKQTESIPWEERIIIHMEDVNFGAGYYEATYFNSTDSITFGLKNLTSLKYKGIPVIRKERVRFQMVIIPTDEYLLVYGVCGVDAGSLIRKMIHIPSSFYTRMKALRDWFTGQIYS